MTTEQNRRIDDIRPSVGLDWDESAAKQARAAFEIPDRWTILLTSSNHGLVGAYGHEFPHATSDHVKVNVVPESVASGLRARIVELESSAAPASADNPSQPKFSESDIPADAPRAFAQRFSALIKENMRLEARIAELEAAADNPSTAGAASPECALCNDSGIVGFPPDQYEDCPDCLKARATQSTPKDTPQSMAESNARYAIDGAIQFGRENRNAPPSGDHWLSEYWNIGRQLAKLGETGWDNVTRLAAPALNPSEVEEQQRDTERLRFVMQDVDGFAGVEWDKYQYALHFASENGREEPNAWDELMAVRMMIDAALIAIKAADQQGALGEKGGE